MKHRLTWLTLGFIVLVAGEVALSIRCAESPKGTPTKPVAAAPVPKPTIIADLTIGGAVRDVGNALHRWDNFVYTYPRCTALQTVKCIDDKERERVAAALRSYILARPKDRLSTDDKTPATASLIVASRNLVVAIADAVEKKR